MGVPIESTLWIAGRVLLGGLFVYGGVHHFFAMPRISSLMAARGVVAPTMVLIAGSVFQIIFGLALILNIYTVWASFALIGFTLTASIMLLNFWNMEGAARENARTAWISNLAIIGGLLIAAAYSV